MGLFPKAADYIRKQAQTGKLTEIYDLELLEEILPHKTLEEYLSFKARFNGQVRKYPFLLHDWIHDKVSELDMGVYWNSFEPGQNIRYFRDYFKETKEEESVNSRGTLIELKAYGQSLKIDREVIAFEGKFYDDRLSTYTDKTDNASQYDSSDYLDEDLDILPNDLSLLKVLVENDCIQCLDANVLNEILAASLSEQRKAIQDLSAVVRGEEFLYNTNPNQFYLRRYHYSQLCEQPDLNSYDGYYLLDEVLEDLRLSIAQSYVLSPDCADEEWTASMRAKLKSYVVKDYAAELLEKLEPIKKIAEERIAVSVKEVQRKRNRKRIFALVVLLLLGAFSYNNYLERSNSEGKSVTPLSTTEAVGTTGTSTTTVPTGPGDYYLSENAIEGATLYRDVKKKSKLGHRLRSMDKIQIRKVEGDMGFFESFFDNNYNQVPKGWVDMKNLVPEEGFYTYEYGKYYRVKSDADRVIVYKDVLKKGRYRSVLSSMDRINVYKIVGTMAYFKDFYSGGYGISGWVDLDKIDLD